MLYSKFVHQNKMDSTDRTQDICRNFAWESISEKKITGISDGTSSVDTNKPCTEGFVLVSKTTAGTTIGLEVFANSPSVIQ